MLKKSTLFFILIACKSTVVLAGYGFTENRALSLISLIFFNQYINYDWLTSYPITKKGNKQADAGQSNGINKEDNSGSVGCTTTAQGSLRDQHADNKGGDKPPLPPNEDKKERCGAECLPFTLRKIVQVGQAPVSFTFNVKKEELLVKYGNSPWCQILLTQGSGFVQVSLHWYHKAEDQKLWLWPIARTSKPLPETKVLLLEEPEKTPESSSDFINLTGEFPSNSESVFSELQIEVQLLDDNGQILSNMVFSIFDNYAPYFQAYNPLGVGDFEMYNHQSHGHEGFYDPFATPSNAPPFPNCHKCQSIANTRGAYSKWLDYLNKYIKDHKLLNLKVIIKSKE